MVNDRRCGSLLFGDPFILSAFRTLIYFCSARLIIVEYTEISLRRTKRQLRNHSLYLTLSTFLSDEINNYPLNTEVVKYFQNDHHNPTPPFTG